MTTIAKNVSIKLFATACAALCVACADTSAMKSQPEEPRLGSVCSGAGQGLSASPTPDTRAAMNAYKAAMKMTLAELQDGVAKGDSSAQVELGLRYANAAEVAADPDRALSLFKAAAKQGNPLAFYFIGIAYAQGSGVDKDESRAVPFWEEAAKVGYPNAQYWLGFYIANGRGGIDKNWCASIPLFEAAAAENITDAAFMLGVAYQTGEVAGDVEGPDYEKAANWYRKANKIEFNQKAQYNLRLLIERYQIQWKKGDPGKPAPPRPKQTQQQPSKKLDIKDPTVDSVG